MDMLSTTKGRSIFWVCESRIEEYPKPIAADRPSKPVVPLEPEPSARRAERGTELRFRGARVRPEAAKEFAISPEACSRPTVPEALMVPVPVNKRWTTLENFEA